VTENLYRVSAKPPPPPPPPDPYLLAWASLRRRRALALTTLIGFVLTVVPAVALHLSSSFVLFAGMAIVALVSMSMATNFQCPHCGRPFARKDARWRDPFENRCVHCGIVIGTPRSAVERTQPREQTALVEQLRSLPGEPRHDSELELRVPIQALEAFPSEPLRAGTQTVHPPAQEIQQAIVDVVRRHK
jgi:hypothetical protein